MKFARILFFFIGLCFTASSMATVNLKFDFTVDMLVANEERVSPKKTGMFSSKKSLTLPNGENQIVFQYAPVFEEGFESISVKSRIIIATFEASDTNLTLVFPNYRDSGTAQEQIANLKWSLVDDDGNTIKHTEDTLERPGMQLGRDFATEAQQYNAKRGIAALSKASSRLVASTSTANAAIAPQPAFPVATVTSTVKSTAITSAPISNTDTIGQSSTAVTNNTAEEMLHFWYAKADEATKQRFKAFINQN